MRAEVTEDIAARSPVSTSHFTEHVKKMTKWTKVTTRRNLCFKLIQQVRMSTGKSSKLYKQMLHAKKRKRSISMTRSEPRTPNHHCICDRRDPAPPDQSEKRITVHETKVFVCLLAANLSHDVRSRLQLSRKGDAAVMVLMKDEYDCSLNQKIPEHRRENSRINKKMWTFLK